MHVQPIARTKGSGKYKKRRQGGESMQRRRIMAAIDVGTNNCRLLVAKPSGHGFKVIDSFSEVVRLGEGLGQGNQLCDEAIERTVEALKICAEKVARHDDILLRSVATEACRRATNGADFLAYVRRETGIRLETISCKEEATLTLTGVRPLIDFSKSHVLVFDIGGGSTEVIWAKLESDDNRGGKARVIDVLSVPDGVVTLSERYGSGPISSSAYEQIMAYVDSYLTPFDAKNGISRSVNGGAVQMIGTSGTVTTLGGMHLGLKRYNRKKVDGLNLDFDVIHQLSAKLACQSVTQRASAPCIGMDRADLMAMGCAILEAITGRWPVGFLRVADRGIREGVLTELLHQQSRPNEAP